MGDCCPRHFSKVKVTYHIRLSNSMRRRGYMSHYKEEQQRVNVVIEK